MTIAIVDVATSYEVLTRREGSVSVLRTHHRHGHTNNTVLDTFEQNTTLFLDISEMTRSTDLVMDLKSFFSASKPSHCSTVEGYRTHKELMIMDLKSFFSASKPSHCSTVEGYRTHKELMIIAIDISFKMK